MALTISNQEITLKSKPGVTESEIQKIASKESTLGEFSLLRPSLNKEIYKFNIKTNTNVEELISRLKKDPEIEIVNPVYLFKNEMKLRVTDRFVVQFKRLVTRTEIDALNAKHHVEVIDSDKGSPNRYILKVTGVSDLSVLEMANLYYKNPDIVYSLPDFLTEINLWSIPNDTYFTDQYYLRNTGQTGGVSGADINVTPAWDITTGSSSITVAVIDEGGGAHEDLPSSRIVPGYDYVYHDSDPSAGGNEAHGMACAGIIAATQNNNMGISGIAPNSKIMFIRIFDDWGNGVSNLSDLVDAINFPWQHGADILSNSWGFGQQGYWNDDIAAAINNALTLGRGGKGCVVVFAAGNRGFIAFPATVPGVITVGATDKSNNLWTYSGRGSQLSVVAPSGALGFPLPENEIYLMGDVWSTDIPGQPGWNDGTYGISNPHTHFIHYSWNSPGGDSYPPGNYTAHHGGTSAACPQVSGVAALMLAVNPDLTESQVKTIIENTASDMGTPGYDTDFGYGRLNAGDAVNVAFGAPATPSGLTIERGLKNFYLKKFYIRLKWDANTDPDLSLYEIWRKLGNGNWINIGTSTTNQYDELDYFYGGNIDLYYKVRAKDTDNYYSFFSDVVNGSGSPAPKAIGENKKEENVISEYLLSSNYPNPFNPSTVIHYEIPNDGLVTIKVYDELGREVKTLVNQYQSMGRYDVNFNATNLASGVYIYRLQFGSYISTKKMLLLK